MDLLCTLPHVTTNAHVCVVVHKPGAAAGCSILVCSHAAQTRWPTLLFHGFSYAQLVCFKKYDKWKRLERLHSSTASLHWKTALLSVVTWKQCMLPIALYYANITKKLSLFNTSQPQVLHTESGNLPLFELLVLSCQSYCLTELGRKKSFDLCVTDQYGTKKFSTVEQSPEKTNKQKRWVSSK